MAVDKTKPPLNPFTPHDIAGAQAVVDSGQEVLELIAKCNACGMEFQPLAEQAKAMIQFAQGVIQHFKSGSDLNA